MCLEVLKKNIKNLIHDTLAYVSTEHAPSTIPDISFYTSVLYRTSTQQTAQTAKGTVDAYLTHTQNSEFVTFELDYV
jgi:hypothetical protein